MDPYQQNPHIQAMMASMGVVFMLFGLVFAVFMIFLFWRIFTKAGLAGPLALLFLVPAVGWIIVPCILAFARWNVVPVPPQFGALPPHYPPYPPYPPPPPSPPAQL